MKMKFYKCEDCNRTLLDMGCAESEYKGNDFKVLEANTEDAAVEKHIPVTSYRDGVLTVKVGSVEHPMTEEHYIEWIFVEREKGGSYVNLTPKDKPTAKIHIEEGEKVTVYAYCNLHGLWKSDFENKSEEVDFSEMVCSPEFPEGCM